jgi:hypothetical protein
MVAVTLPVFFFGAAILPVLVSVVALFVDADTEVSAPLTGVVVELFSDSLLHAATKPQILAAIIPADINFKLLKSIILLFNKRIVWSYNPNGVPGSLHPCL